MKKSISLMIVVMIILSIGLSGCTSTNTMTSEVDGEKKETKTYERIPDEDIQNLIEEAKVNEDKVLTLSFYSDAISSNTINDDPNRNVSIYLPQGYYDNEDLTYPVVYYLDGYECDAQEFLNDRKESLDEAFNGNKPFIMVAVDGNNITGGSFYVDSPVSGNWEVYLTQELVSMIDNNFRVKADSKYRGISGYSMGGFGALYIAFRNPDIFGSVLAFAPGIYAEEDIDMVMDTWRGDQGLLNSYAQAFSPDTTIEGIQGNIPAFDDSESDQEYVDNWINGFSGWKSKIDDYLNQQTKLNGIAIAYSNDDFYAWIPRGCDYLDGLLTENEISHRIYNYDGGHIVPADAIESYYTLFFEPIFDGS